MIDTPTPTPITQADSPPVDSHQPGTLQQPSGNPSGTLPPRSQGVSQEEEERSLLNEYLSVVQQSTVDLLYRVDIQTNTMYHFSDFVSALGGEKIIPNYVSVFMERNTIHPDDQATYMRAFQQFYEKDKLPDTPIRFALGGGDYHWYRITGKKIYGTDGKLKEVFGALVNVDREVTMNQEVTALHQYIQASQTLTGESLFYVDMSTRILRQKGRVAEELGLPEEIYSYPEGAYPYIHPTDLALFKEFARRTLAGQDSTVEVRVHTAQGDYQWYEIVSTLIWNEAGNMVEVFGRMTNIHDRHALAQEMAEANNYLMVMQELSDDILYRIDLETNTLHYTIKGENGDVNTHTYPDYPESTFNSDLVHPDDREKLRQQTQEWKEGNMSEYKLRLRLVSDQFQWYQDNAIKICDKEGNIKEIYGRLKNIDHEVAMQADYSALNQYFSAMQKLSDDILFHIDIATRTFYHSDKNALDMGMPIEIPNFLEAFTQKGFIFPEHCQDFTKYMEKLLAGINLEYQVKASVGNGTYEWFNIRSEYIFDGQGKPTEIFGTMQNIQRQRNLEERAYHDMMTGALNKVTFEEEASYVLSQSETSEKHGLIFIDLDDFKGVNDSLGHDFGDSLLITVGKRLKRLIRGDDLVGRIGGDEFAVLLRDVEDEASVLHRTQVMLEALQRDFSFKKKVVSIKASMGVAVYPAQGTSYQDLIVKADLAVYHSKGQGKNRVSMYTPALEKQQD